MQLAGNRSLDGFLAHFRAPSVGCPRCRRHETGPSTTFKPDPSTIPRFPENRRPSTCGFIFARDAMVGGCRPNVVDGPVSWREAPGAAGVEPDGRAAAAPPSRGARPAGLVGHRGPIALESVPHPRRRPRKVFPKLSLHRRPSSRIVLHRTGA